LSIIVRSCRRGRENHNINFASRRDGRPHDDGRLWPVSLTECGAEHVTLARLATWSILDHMQRTSLVSAKAHLSELVDAAEHRGQRILILRHGKPAAAIVPVGVAERASKARPMTEAQAEALLDDLAAGASPSEMSVDEALGRSRLGA
jgi:prevent-host-death family protein